VGCDWAYFKALIQHLTLRQKYHFEKTYSEQGSNLTVTDRTETLS
jgi:hypothetical protein